MTWRKGFDRLPHAQKILLPYFQSSILETFVQCSAQGINLIQEMLCYDPAKRISAREALGHAFFEARDCI